MASKPKLLGWTAAVVASLGMVLGQTAPDTLLRGFRNPPDSARPRVWWHWMNGNISQEGIRADLEWMKRIGIAGVQNFDAALNTPQVVEKRLVYMTPEWKDAFRYATSLADQLGLELAIAGSPGWSESGGPWVPAAQAMKKYVWSEMRVEGGRPFTGSLPKPPAITGAYQNQTAGGRGANGPADFYADAAVVAYRAPAEGGSPAQVTASGGTFDLESLTDGDVARFVPLPAPANGERAWVQYEFAQLRTVRGITLVTGGRGGARQLESSADGQQFQTVAAIPGGARTVAFPAVTARFFRVTFLSAAGRGGPAGSQVAELVLHEAVVNRFQEKAGFSAATGIYDMATPAVPADAAIRKSDVIDLTGRMRSDGTLDWTPPAGNWVVLRIGYSLTGHQNSPASPEATGFEVDKLNRAYVKSYFDNYLDQYKDATGGLMGKRGLQYVITDSWEAGVANWTDDMMPEFNRRRGYDMKPWLPVLAGRVVESAEASDRFLWDFRKTLSDMVVENHYDQLTSILRERGMGRYTESHETGRAMIADGMEVKRTADIPMSAMWTTQPGRADTAYDSDIRESASVAHIYGQNLVAAESLTARGGAWSFSPETLKATADREMSMGLNRFVIHTSAHQPVSDKVPGLGLGPFGQWFTRHETWAELAAPWITYLARSSYLLQQGNFVADVAYYYGEDSNVTALFGANAPQIPQGVGFDYVNADALLHRLSVTNGRLTTTTGMSYRLLALDANSRHMSLGVLRKLRDLVEAGAVIVGPKPIDSPSLADDQAQFQAIADSLWGGRTGRGKVYEKETIAEALVAQGTAPDFEYSKPGADTELAFVHRRLSDGDMYWVSNRNAHPENVDATFRVQGKAPELWHADTGVTEAAEYRIAGGRTTVPLRLEANDAVFVVFRKAATGLSRALPARRENPLGAVDGGWEVTFQPDRGAPAQATLDVLASWSENSDPGVKYFAGTGTYRKNVQAPADWFRTGDRLWLDLGDVKNLAQVTINGKDLGTYWKAPFRVDVTSVLKPGANRVEIKVTNLWVNRLIGDQQPDAARKYTYTTQQFYRADSALLPSGLLGPVQFVRSEQ